METLPTDVLAYIIKCVAGGLVTNAEQTMLKQASMVLFTCIPRIHADAGVVKDEKKCTYIQVATRRMKFISASVSGNTPGAVLSTLACSCPDIKTLYVTLKTGHESFSLDRFKCLCSLVMWNCNDLHRVLPGDTCVCLHTLTLVDCDLTDISPLKCCPSVVTLTLENCKDLTDISPLQLFFKLKDLSLSRCATLTDIWPLALCENLEVLAVSECGAVTDIKALRWCLKLETFSFLESEIDLGPISGCEQLHKLDLRGCRRFTELWKPTRLPNLTELNLNFTLFKDLNLLVLLLKLTNLSLSNTQAEDLDPLAKLRALTSLDLSSTKAKDLEPLAGLTEMINLSLSSTKAKDLEPLAKLRKLTRLDLSNTPVMDLEPLAKLRKLTRLDLSNTPVMDLEPLNNVDLKVLVIASCYCIAHKEAKVTEFRERGCKVRTD
jgi:hypothetical protein